MEGEVTEKIFFAPNRMDHRMAISLQFDVPIRKENEVLGGAHKKKEMKCLYNFTDSGLLSYSHPSSLKH